MLLAILFPWISFLVRGKVLTGFVCLLLQVTLIGWIPAAIWAVSSRNEERLNKRLDKIQATSAGSQNYMASESKTDELSKQAHKFYDEKDYSSAIGVLNRILVINPRENKIHFNLACCYSLTHNKQAFKSLSNAVEFGYDNFERIKVYNALEWMRNQPEFEDFLKNGYKITDKDTEASIAKPMQQDADKFSQIEKLGQLKTQGFLTEEEFQEQKKKILVSI